MSNPLFILASASPRRLSLLADIGITPDSVLPANIDETPHSSEKPYALAKRLAYEKLKAIVCEKAPAFVLAADTVVAAGRRILPKAESDASVRECLKMLSGRRHHVYTGVALKSPQGKILQRVSDNIVIFRQLTTVDIEEYVKTKEGIGKAGGYAIQGQAGKLIRFISGSYSGIVGLPLFDVAQMLRSLGYPLL